MGTVCYACVLPACHSVGCVHPQETRSTPGLRSWPGSDFGKGRGVEVGGGCGGGGAAGRHSKSGKTIPRVVQTAKSNTGTLAALQC